MSEKNTKIIHEAKKAYEYMTDNHPTIHSNRFASWSELSQDSKDRYIEEYKRTGKIS